MQTTPPGMTKKIKICVFWITQNDHVILFLIQFLPFPDRKSQPVRKWLLLWWSGFNFEPVHLVDWIYTSLVLSLVNKKTFFQSFNVNFSNLFCLLSSFLFYYLTSSFFSFFYFCIQSLKWYSFGFFYPGKIFSLSFFVFSFSPFLFPTLFDFHHWNFLKISSDSNSQIFYPKKIQNILPLGFISIHTGRNPLGMQKKCFETSWRCTL